MAEVNVITVEWLVSKNPCTEAMEWARPLLNGGKSTEDCIAAMDRADWLLWLLWHTGTVNIRQLVKLACIVTRRSLPYAAPGDQRPRRACEAAEAWVKVPGPVNAAAARAAGDAVWAAGDASAASAAAWAAEAAASTAEAASTAANAAWAAGAAAEAAAHSDLCTLIRTELHKPEFNMLTM